MNINLSIVMATNNPINLNSFLKNLYLEMPSNFEIIVVFPISKKNLLSDVNKDYLNLKFIYSSIENQVIQRIMGFKEAKGDYILQIPSYNNKLITPLTESFQTIIWHMLVSNPKLQLNKTKW